MTAKINAKISGSGDAKTLKTLLDQLSAKHPNPNIEDVLSFIRTIITVADKVVIANLEVTALRALEKNICDSIAEMARVPLPESTPYHQLAAWIKGVNRTAPVELFTTNYDLLLESALEGYQVPYFDGFIGADKPFFDAHAIEAESEQLPARWARLWKLHGSINWWANSTEEPSNVFRSGTIAGEQRLIHPSHLKYDESRQMPYLAMMDRLKTFLRRPGALLITIGYSFSDRHINALLRQSLTGNADATIFGLLFKNLDQYPDAVKVAAKTPNLSLFARDKGIIGTLCESWGINLYGTPETGVEKEANDPESKKFIVSLGDFQKLGMVLSELTGSSLNAVSTPPKAEVSGK